MKKSRIVTFVCLIGLAGFVIWILPSFGVKKPFARVIHIQTSGGPVPIKVVIYDSKGGRIEVGYSGLPNNDASLISGNRGDFLVTDFAYSPFRIELEFPRSNAMLKVEEVTDDGGEKRLVGYWRQKEKDGVAKELQVTRHLKYIANWFDEAAEDGSDEPEGKVDGQWLVEFEGSDEKALLKIIQWVSMKGETKTEIDAEFLSYHTTNRFYAGRVDGDLVRLASFENGVPVLIHSTIQHDGTLKGDLWIGNWEHHSWTATREPVEIEP